MSNGNMIPYPIPLLEKPCHQCGKTNLKIRYIVDETRRQDVARMLFCPDCGALAEETGYTATDDPAAAIIPPTMIDLVELANRMYNNHPTISVLMWLAYAFGHIEAGRKANNDPTG